MLQDGKPVEAREAARHALEIDPQTAQEGLTEAQQHFERAVALDPRLAEAHAGQGGAWLSSAISSRAAQRAVERAVQLDPKSSAPYCKLAELYRKAGERERAQNALEKFSGTQGKRASGQGPGSHPGVHKTARSTAG